MPEVVLKSLKETSLINNNPGIAVLLKAINLMLSFFSKRSLRNNVFSVSMMETILNKEV